MQWVAGWCYPDGDHVTKALRARLESEEVYRGDRLADALKHVTRFRTAVDIGAHIGAWSRELAMHFKRVVAIEPNSAAAACIRTNCSGRRNVEVIEMAASDRTGDVELYQGKGSISSAIDPGIIGQTITQPLDDLAITEVDYMKVHCNGYELPALRGARETIAQCRPVLTVVIKPAVALYGFTAEDIHHFMHEIGYVVVSRLKPYFVFAPKK